MGAKLTPCSKIAWEDVFFVKDDLGSAFGFTIIPTLYLAFLQ